MSQENVELVQATHAAVNRRDLDALLALVHPEVEFQSLIAEAEGRHYRGHAGVREWWESVIESLGGMHSEIEHIETSEDGGICRVRLTGEVEGVGLSQTVWQAFRVRDGATVWWCFYRTEAEALEAARLSE
ncbi:MAG: nuclear transport factor 2 family protein [Actinomycetota bacterium]